MSFPEYKVMGYKSITYNPLLFTVSYPFKASEPLTISIISLVMEAWRALL